MHLQKNGMISMVTMKFLSAAMSVLVSAQERPDNIGSRPERVAIVTETPGLVAFWDFVKRESIGAQRFTAHVPAGTSNQYPLDVGNIILEYWGEGRKANYDDFPLLGRGPFGQAIQIRQEKDPNHRSISKASNPSPLWYG